MAEPIRIPASLPQPHRLGRRQRAGLYLAGWLDRWRCRQVPDHEHTHFTRRLLAQRDSGHALLNQWKALRELELRTQLAGLDLFGDDPDAPEPVDADDAAFSDLSGVERHHWGRRLRDRRQLLADHTAMIRSRRALRARRRELEVELNHLADRVTAAQVQWTRAYEERLALYVRARTRGLISAPPTTARLPVGPGEPAAIPQLTTAT